MSQIDPFQKVFDAELTEIVDRRWKINEKKGLAEDQITQNTVCNELVGLALSGGGVRSGATSLGLLQSVYDSEFLQDIDYLSTVSGGSYAGAFLSSDAVCNRRSPIAAKLKRQQANDMQSGPNQDNDSNPPHVDAGVQSAVSEDDQELQEFAFYQPKPGEPSQRMLRFIFGGKYLRDTFGFLNRQFFGMLLVMTVVISALLTVSALVAWLVRLLDHQTPRYVARALGFESEYALAMIPAMFFFLLWLAMWGFSYLRRISDRPKTVALFAFYIFVFFLMVGFANIIGTGDLFFSQSSPISSSTFLQKSWGFIVAAIGASLLPYLAPKYLIQSGTRPRNSVEKYSFWIATNGLLFGLPFLFVGIMLQENISGVNDYRSGKIVARSELRGWSRGTTWNRLWRQIDENLGESSADFFPPGGTVLGLVGGYELENDRDRPAALELLDENYLYARDLFLKKLNRPDYRKEFLWWSAIPPSPPEDKVKLTSQQIQACFDALSLTSKKITDSRAESVISRWLCILPTAVLNDNTPLADQYEVFRDEDAIKNFLGCWLGYQMSSPDFYKLVMSKKFVKASERSKPKIAVISFLGSLLQVQIVIPAWNAQPEYSDSQKKIAKLIDRMILANKMNATQPRKIVSAVARSEIENLNRELLDIEYGDSVFPKSAVKSYVCLDSDQRTRFKTMLFAFGIFLLASVCVNLNSTSCHSFYRNRLAKMWIESGQRENPITLPLLETTQRGYPYHLISGSMAYFGKFDHSRGQEKIDHFLFSQKYCGSERAGFMKTNEFMGGKMTLANAVAISGAAISVVHIRNAFIMFLLFITNLRLGQWLDNPRTAVKWNRLPSAPLLRYFAVTPLGLLINLFKNADDRPVVFVADGGHFENLAIDELLHRRCRLIVALDAGADPESKLEDLNRLIRWSRMKRGIKLTPISAEPVSDAKFVDQICGTRWLKQNKNQLNLGGANDTTWSRKNYLMWKIEYPQQGLKSDGQPSCGVLIYIKNTMTGNEPLELIKFQRDNPDFPHDSTSDQFFSPGKFESYRHLGQYLGQSVCRDIRQRILAGEFQDNEILDCLELARNLIPLRDEILDPQKDTQKLVEYLFKRLTATPDWQRRRIANRLQEIKEQLFQYFDTAILAMLLEVHASSRDHDVTTIAKGMLENFRDYVPQILEIVGDEKYQRKAPQQHEQERGRSETAVKLEALKFLLDVLIDEGIAEPADLERSVAAIQTNFELLKQVDDAKVTENLRKFKKKFAVPRKSTGGTRSSRRTKRSP